MTPVVRKTNLMSDSLPSTKCLMVHMKIWYGMMRYLWLIVHLKANLHDSALTFHPSALKNFYVFSLRLADSGLDVFLTHLSKLNMTLQCSSSTNEKCLQKNC